ncbi:hypothetical protein J5N97_001174 [Dioscorea zingiberensis]|uniref:Protein XRI1 n=1 Tax=Dioscorea zingiberensis TaxID=325984 RepID=A0A9D5BUA8_9LILI|nr:hypothetical protein J5N97_001174 [Dioscorea zingiberensis]
MWEWPQEECFLRGNTEIGNTMSCSSGFCGLAHLVASYALVWKLVADVSEYLWNDVTQNEDSFLCMLEEHTPVKDFPDFDRDMMNTEDNSCKNSQVSLESSQHKRRRMLQFSPDSYSSANEQNNVPLFKSQVVRVDSTVEDGLLDNMQQWSSVFSDGRCAYDNDGSSKSTEVALLENCLNESDMQNNPDEMNYHIESCKQTKKELCNIPLDTGNDVMQMAPTPNYCRIFKGRKSFIQAPAKLTTSVAYPFALIKPCGVQGDVTLKDINQLIHAPPPSKPKSKMDEDSSMPYPTSAFSGKPVVVQTKIHTEGGRGSITIMRTKG